MLETILAAISPLNQEAMEKCQLRLDNLSKPLNSLHSFEHLACKLAGITGNPRPRSLPKSFLIVNGGAMADSQATTAVHVFAEHVSAKIVQVDIHAAVHDLAIPAMRVRKAVETGIKAVSQEIHQGAKVIGLGYRGTDSRAAGTMIVDYYSSNSGRKSAAADSDVKYHLGLLQNAGNMEIAGLVGVIIGAAAGRAAVVMDGLATSAAALVAVQMLPGIKEYLVGAHFSVEPVHTTALTIMGVPAYLHLDMPCGDGSGAALGMSLLNASLHMLNDMKTFGEAEVAVAQDGPGALRQSKDVKD
ncbi:MAG: nicotinate-nucleotide--dimethylbenzimidazole phosphoribosyltransferase [Negativicutes bacterium]|nr:nicotinate-nucleotide--dimethylbenzimidazole phosphoribosyltransferase [Negativicutes bacterium]